MKQILTISTILLIFTVQVFAQGGKFYEKREDIKKKKYAFIIKELQLTEKEKQEFMPLFKEYDEKRENLHDQRRKLMKNFKHNSLNMTDEELNVIIDKFVETDIKLAELGKIYTERFKKVISPMKIILLHHAENEFKREILKHAHNKKTLPQH